MRRAALAIIVLGLVSGLAAAEAHAQQRRATLTLVQVLGQPATSLVVPFGTIDAMCLTPPAAGVTCAPNIPANGATWYGTVRFRIRLAGPAGLTVRLTGVRQAGGTAPAGTLVDGPAGVPLTPYPTSPAGALTLVTAIPRGTTVVNRSIGFRLTPTDPSGGWVTSIVYSLIVE